MIEPPALAGRGSTSTEISYGARWGGCLGRGNGALTELEIKFAEIEKRVRKLAAENHSFKKRIRELELELDHVRGDARKAVQFHDKQLRVRERIEKILHDLETIDAKKADPE